MCLTCLFSRPEEKKKKKKMDLPSGPLDVYRCKASFSRKEMLDFLEGEDIQAFKVARSESSPSPWQR